MDDQRKKKWEQIIPQVMEAGSCRFCKEKSHDGYSSFWGKCKHFGKRQNHHRDISGEGSKSGHARYLEMYRKDIFKPLIDKYPVKLEQGVGQILLFAHGHTTLEINERRVKEDLTKVPDERVFAGIPIYPMGFDLGATTELFLHCMEMLALIQQRFGEEPLDIHVQMGSSQTAIAAATHALYTYIRAIGETARPPPWSVYDYNIDHNYDGDHIATNLGSKYHIMTTNFIDFRDYVAKNRRTSHESAEKKKEITRLESELSKTTALLGGLKKEITHLKTELAGLDSELLKVTSLLSDYGSALSAESVRINSLLEKKSEEE